MNLTDYLETPIHRCSRNHTFRGRAVWRPHPRNRARRPCPA
jgi:hypothetical protein